MTKKKNPLVGQTVWLAEEIVPYEGVLYSAIFADPEEGMKHLEDGYHEDGSIPRPQYPYKWKKEENGGFSLKIDSFIYVVNPMPIQ